MIRRLLSRVLFGKPVSRLIIEGDLTVHIPRVYVESVVAGGVEISCGGETRWLAPGDYLELTGRVALNCKEPT